MPIFPEDIQQLSYQVEYGLTVAAILGNSALILFILGGVSDLYRVKIGGWSMRYTLVGILLVWVVLGIIGWLVLTNQL
jgi:hypothetical protein